MGKRRERLAEERTKIRSRTGKKKTRPSEVPVKSFQGKAAFGGMNLQTHGLLGLEKKFYDTGLAPHALTAPTDASGGEHDPTNAPCTTIISAPAQGDGAQNRDGKSIKIVAVEIKGSVQTAVLSDQGDMTTPTEVFVALVLDTQTNGAQMNSEDCFTNPSGSQWTATAPLRNLSYARRFRVLKNWRMVLEPKSVGSDNAGTAAFTSSIGGDTEQFECYLPLDMPVNFVSGGTTADVANVIDRSLHIIAYASHTTQTPKITYNARVRFLP